MQKLKAPQFEAAVAGLREEFEEELEKRGLEIRALRRALHKNDFAIWLIEKDRRDREPSFLDVAWSSGGIASAAQLDIALSLARDFIAYLPPLSTGVRLTM